MLSRRQPDIVDVPQLGVPQWPERFRNKVAVSDSNSCWEWQAFCLKGYGRFRVSSHFMAYAHRVALEYKIGRRLRPDELACHTCDNKRCVNPAHLYVGTASDNMRDASDRGQHARLGPDGERNHFSKLTWAEVDEIRKTGVPAGVDIHTFALRYGVTGQSISNILKGRTWRPETRR